MYLTVKPKFPKDNLNMTNLDGLLHTCKKSVQDSNIQTDIKQLMKEFVPLLEDVVFLQFNNMKPVRRGIKLYIHACSESGYCQAFNIYLGADSTEPSKNGATFDVVWNLVEVLQNKYYCIYFDNLYTSIPLLRFMHSKGLYGCGIIQKLRKFLPSYVNDPGKKMKRGDN